MNTSDFHLTTNNRYFVANSSPKHRYLKLMKNLKDEDLVRLYVETQKNVYFETIYERYCDKVYRKCLSFTKNPVEAEDLTHDIFLKLAVRVGSFKEQAKFSTWLYSVTYNYCTDHVRSPRRKSELYMDDGWDKVDVATEDDGLAELAEMKARHLQKALQRMAPDEQALLMMKYQDEVSIREIAEVYEITESAVKMRLKRSREKLRKYYLEGAIFWLLMMIKAAFSIRWPFRW